METDQVRLTRRMTDALRRTRPAALCVAVCAFLIAGIVLLAGPWLGPAQGLGPRATVALGLGFAALALTLGLWAVPPLRYGAALYRLEGAEAVERVLVRHQEVFSVTSAALAVALALIPLGAVVQALRAHSAPAAASRPGPAPARETPPPKPPAAREPAAVIPDGPPGEESGRLDRECGAGGRNYLCLLGDAGEPVTDGTRIVLTERNATFLIEPGKSELSVRVSAADRWEVEFGAPKGEGLRRAFYLGAQRTPFRKEKAPGLSVTNRSACNEVRGRFRIWAYDLDAAGRLQRLGADFVQVCDEIPIPLVGRVVVERMPPPSTPD